MVVEVSAPRPIAVLRHLGAARKRDAKPRQEQPNLAADLARSSSCWWRRRCCGDLIAPNAHLGATDFMLIGRFGRAPARFGGRRCSVRRRGRRRGFFEPLGITARAGDRVISRLREMPICRRVRAPGGVFVGTLLAESLSVIAQFLLGRQAPLDFFVTRVVVPALILNTLLAAPVYVAARWWMRGERTRRALET
jgi:hypothetical protein